MRKSTLFEIIKSVTINEMARIPVLFQLSTTDHSELESMIPDDLKKSSKTKEIIDFYLENGNKPSSAPDIVKHYGYAAQQLINTQFQRLRAAGVLIDKGLSFPKQIKSVGSGIQGRVAADVNSRSNEEKLKYIMSSIKNGKEPNSNYKDWFIQTHGEDKYSELKNLINNYQKTFTKDKALEIQNEIRAFLTSLGFTLKKRGRKPGEIPSFKLTPGEDGFDDVSYSDEENM